MRCTALRFCVGKKRTLGIHRLCALHACGFFLPVVRRLLSSHDSQHGSRFLTFMYDGIYRLFDRPAHKVSDLVGTGIVALLFSSSRLPGTDEIF